MSEETQTVTDVISKEEQEELKKMMVNPHDIERKPDDLTSSPPSSGLSPAVSLGFSTKC